MNFDSKQQSLLTFRVGPVLCCAPSLPVRSIITPPKLTKTPGCDASQPGIFKHGSHIVKVLDLRQKFGIDQAEQTHPGNLIITIFEKESFAFWVDQILDVFDFPSEGWGNLPAAIPRGIFTRTLLLNKKIHLYSEFENLATIQDLGYLKHYIQQLKQQEETKTIDESVASKISEPTNTIDNESSPKPTSPIKTDKIKSDTSIQKSPDKNSTGSNKASTSPSSPKANINKNEVVAKSDQSSNATFKNTSKSSETKPATTILKTSNRNTLDENKVMKSYSSHKPTTTKENAIPLTETFSSQNTNYKNNTDNFSTPKTQPLTSSTQVEKNNQEDESSSTGTIIFILFILGLFAAGFYYMFDNVFTNSSKYKKQKPVYSAPIIQSPIEIKKDEPEPLKTEEKNIEEISTENTSNENTTAIPTEEKVKIAEVTQKPIEDNEYRAEIIQQENEITITIHQPVAIEEIKPEETAVPTQKIEKIEDEITITTEPVESLKPIELVEKIPPKKIINEVVHIVVRGDTLWAIAKKYVDDPFLYPELARLSNIKNPHRIYPGNRVRIRFIKN